MRPINHFLDLLHTTGTPYNKAIVIAHSETPVRKLSKPLNPWNWVLKRLDQERNLLGHASQKNAFKKLA